MAQNGDSVKNPDTAEEKEEVEQESARDPRDEASSILPRSRNRPVSPFTAAPTVDFDGLSWPSE